jgi:hypothetical protein
MPERISPSTVYDKRKTSDSTERRELIQPPVWWNFEYVGPVIWQPPNSVWSFDFSLANRGLSDESFCIILTVFQFEPDQPSEVTPVYTARAGRVFLENWTQERLAVTGEDNGWWARIFTTSRNVVPSIHVYGESLAVPPPRPAPDFYVSPGDFAVFEGTGVAVPPGSVSVNKP